MGRKVSATPTLHAVQLEPLGHGGKLLCEFTSHPALVLPLLRERALRVEPAGLTVRLEIDATDQLSVKQKRQYVVSVLALLLGHVDLDLKCETEQPLCAAPFPNHPIERRQQCPRLDTSGRLRLGVQVRRVSPAFDRDLTQLAFLHEFMKQLRMMGNL